jgi:uncharacterized protein YeaO (DUF488 family)
MSTALKLRTYRCGEPAKRGAGLRIAVTRRPPRGVARENWKEADFCDVWFPFLAPSEKLLRKTLADGLETAAKYRAFCTRYEREIMSHAEGRQALALFAALARKTPVSIGCFCEVESRCHRAHLHKLILRAADSL